MKIVGKTNDITTFYGSAAYNGRVFYLTFSKNFAIIYIENEKRRKERNTMFDEEGNYIGARYTVYYKAHLFDDEQVLDESGWCFIEADRWGKAVELYGWCTANGIEVELVDNKYSVTLSKGEWY